MPLPSAHEGAAMCCRGKGATRATRGHSAAAVTLTRRAAGSRRCERTTQRERAGATAQIMTGRWQERWKQRVQQQRHQRRRAGRGELQMTTAATRNQGPPPHRGPSRLPPRHQVLGQVARFPCQPLSAAGSRQQQRARATELRQGSRAVQQRPPNCAPQMRPTLTPHAAMSRRASLRNRSHRVWAAASQRVAAAR